MKINTNHKYKNYIKAVSVLAAGAIVTFSAPASISVSAQAPVAGITSLTTYAEKESMLSVSTVSVDKTFSFSLDSSEKESGQEVNVFASIPRSSKLGEEVSCSYLMEDKNGTAGTFTLRASDLVSLYQIAELKVAVWTDQNPENVVWYTPQADGEGNFITSVDVKDFDRYFGNYHSQLIYVYTDGREETVADITGEISGKNYIYLEAEDSTHVKVHLMAPAKEYETIQIGAYPQGGDAADAKWIDAVKQEDGTYTVSLNGNDFNTTGTFTMIAHGLYEGNWEDMGTLDFQMAQNKYKNTWHLVDGVNYHYDENGFMDQSVELSATQKRIIENAANNNARSGARSGYCARWVRSVYQASGTNFNGCNAINFWDNWKSSGSTDWTNIPAGAAVVSTGTGRYGHVGIYIGNGMVAENYGGFQIVTLSEFRYRNTNTTMRGYNGWIGWVWPGGYAR